jgi:hypothetical protein
VADQEARFSIELETKGRQEGEELASALARLRDQIKADQAAINEMSAAMKRLQMGGQTNVAVFKQLRDGLAAKKASLAAAQEQYVSLGGTFGGIKEAVKETKGGFDELLATAQGAGGPLGSLAGGASRLKGMLGKGGAAGGVLLLVAAIGLLVAAALTGLVKFAVLSADAARSQRIFFEAATGGGAAAGALAAQVAAVAGRVGLARAAIEELALSLARSGLQGRALDAALSAVATTSSVMGQAAGSTLQGIAERARQAKVLVLGALDLQGTGLKIGDVGQALAKRMGISVQAAVAAIQNGRVRVEAGLQALDDAVQAKFGKAALAQTLSLSHQFTKLREDLAHIFDGVDVEPLLRGLRDVLSIFDQTTFTGKMLRSLAETLLTPLIAGLSTIAPIAKAFFQGLIIGALVAAIVFLKLRNAFRDVFGGDTKSNIDWVKTAMYAGAIVAVYLAATFGLVALAIGGVAKTAVWLWSKLIDGYNFVKSLGWGALGTWIVEGIVNGLKGGAKLLVDAVKGLGQLAKGAFTTEVKINSPSRVFYNYGLYMDEGLALGVEAGSGRVEDAVDTIAVTPGKRPSAASVSARAQRGGSTYNITQNFNGIRDDEELLAKMTRAITELFEGEATMAGAPLQPEGA